MTKHKGNNNKMAKRRKRLNGEGSVYKRSDGLWCAALTLPNGKRRVVSARSQAGALAKLEEAKKERGRGVTATADTTVSDYLGEWLAVVIPSLRPSTAKRYGELVRHATDVIGDRKLRKLAAADIELLYSTLLGSGLSAATVRRVRTVVFAALERAASRGLAPANPVRTADGKPKEERGEMQVLDADGVRRLIAEAQGGRLGALVVLAATTGARSGELLGLRWKDIDLDAGTIRIQRSLSRIGGKYTFLPPKTDSSRRTVVLSRVALDSLRQHRQRQLEERLASAYWHDDTLVFTTTAGTPVDAMNFLKRTFRPMLVRAGLPPVRFHDLRHTAASLMLSGGVDVRTVAATLGHSKAATTLNVYAHLMTGQREKAAAVMDAALAASG